jgi:amino acid adenylation domain-containing protein/non-ribosomal peptide synthase protein (TIGR01720 family)
VNPIAIIGIGCRFPEADNVEAFWNLLCEGRDAIREVPPDRWDKDALYDPDPDARGKMTTRWGGFLDDVDKFDAPFFGIADREASGMDPQQRLLLEVTWRALEHAGLPREHFAGSKTGVFIGVSNCDAARLTADLDDVSAYTGTGNSPSIAANRLSYFLDLRGPSLAVDTACSSSLVAAHLAIQSLLAGECTAALVGGVNLILSPEATVAFSKAHMMAADGRCKTFDAAADGYVRGEGAAVVILKPLDAALADGDRVLAVIRGSAINQDGLSNGLTAPNPLAQERVLIDAYERAGVSPGDVQYVELHGTGTQLGDPIEARALGRVMSIGRPEGRPCAVGSVKTNIGHLEAAAGIAGLVKVALALHHRMIPPSLHFQRPNPYIPFDSLPLRVQDRLAPWPDALPGTAALAGVSSFGFGGTNCHVVLEPPPPGETERAPSAVDVASRPEASTQWQLFTLSAKSWAALEASAASHADFLAGRTQADLADICHSANTGRSRLPYRLAATVATTAQLREQLAAARGGARPASPLTGRAQYSKPKIAFLFPGQGSHFASMARGLFHTEARFRATLESCDELLRPHLAAPLLSVLYGGAEEQALLQQTAYAQPVLLALEVALARLWRGWGVEPDCVLGHSLGEYAAACVAGVFSLEDALLLAVRRGRMMQELPTHGAMAAVFDEEEAVRRYLKPYGEALDVAALNSRRNTVVSGRRDSLTRLLKTLRERGVDARMLEVSCGFHSSLMGPILEELGRAVGSVESRPLGVPMVSNLDGEMLAAGHTPDAAYWVRHSREPVDFKRGVKTLLDGGVDVCIEVGPQVVLSTLARESDGHERASFLPSLMRGRDDWQVLLESLGELYVRGAEVDLAALSRGRQRRRVALPYYPFERRAYPLKKRNYAAGRPAEEPERQPDRQPDRQAEAAESPRPAAAGPATQSAAHSAVLGRDEILRRLLNIVSEFFETDAEQVDAHVPFLEMGADSLVLVVAVRRIEQEFGVQLAVRQFFEEINTIDKLAGHLHAALGSAGRRPSSHVESRHASVVGVAGAGARDELRAIRGRVEEIARELDALIARDASDASSAREASPSLLTAPQDVADRARLAGGQGRENDHSSVEPAGGAGAAKKTVLPPWRPAEVRAGGLSSRQQQHLNSLIARHNGRTRGSKEYAARFRPRLADNRASAGFRFTTKEMLYPIVGARSAGSRVWDIDGNEFLDITMGFGVHLFGHEPPFIREALQRQIAEGIQLGPQSRHAGEVAELMCELTGHERVSFCNSGTEAVMTALRLARMHSGRSRVVMFGGSYHGHFDGTLAEADPRHGSHSGSPLVAGVLPNMVEDVLVLEYGAEQSLDIIRRHCDELAAVLVEPVQSRRPDLQPAEFLRELREITRRAGVILIFDEMITGFRIHPGGAQAHFGVDADLGTYGKIIGGGLPIGAVAGRAAIMDGLDGGLWHYGDGSYPAAETTFVAGTFSKNPLGMAAAHATLSELKSRGPSLQEALNARTDDLARRLNAYAEQTDVSLRVVNFGSLFRFTHRGNLDLLFYHLLDKGIYIWEGRNCFLSTAHDERDVDTIFRAVRESVEELRDGDFLPPARNRAGRGLDAETAPAATPAGRPTDGAVATARALPLTAAQQQLWRLAQLTEAGKVAYNVPLFLELRGALDRDALTAAIARLVSRHDSLRGSVAPSGESLLIHESVAADLPFEDLSSLARGEGESACRSRCLELAQHSFDLGSAPLLRAVLLKVSEGRHLLLLVAHHLVVDGLSLMLFVKELAACYTASVRGERAALPAASQFADFVADQSRRAASAQWAADRAYWRELLADPPVFDLPADRPRPALRSYRGRRCTAEIDGGLYDSLRQLAAAQGCTPFMVLLAAYAVFLRRLSGADDLVVGVPSAGRDFEGGDQIVGYCAHLLPLRLRFPRGDAEFSFTRFLRYLRGQLFDALDHANYPYSHILDDAGGWRDPSRSPLVPVTFNFDRVAQPPHFEGLEIGIEPPPVSFSKFDLGMNVTEVRGSLLVELDYNEDLFDGRTAEAYLRQFASLVAGVAANPEQGCGDLPLMGAAERRRLLREWNDTSRAFHGPATVNERIERQAALTPEATAVVCAGESLTYRELDERAGRLARRIARSGLPPAPHVALLLPRSTSMIVSMLATLKAGGAYVPFEPDTPAERLEAMLREAGCHALLTQHSHDSLVRRLSSFRAPVIYADAEEAAETTPDAVEAAADAAEAAPARAAGASSACYILFTSGSTGRPKAVAVSHAAITNYVDAVVERTDLPAGGAYAHLTTFTADLGNTMLFPPLFNGGCLHVIANSLASDAEGLADYFTRHRIDCLKIVPSHLEALLASADEQRLLPRTHLILGGEACGPGLKATLRRLSPACRIFNHYGPTEATVGVLAEEFAWRETDRAAGAGRGQAGEQAGIPLGRPLANCQVYVLDGRGQLAPACVWGELYVGGAGLAVGYLNQPVLTAERFIPDPFGREPGARLYRTGDRARILPDGTLELGGRVDEQIKIRGYRVEPGEVAAALRAHPRVGNVAVVARRDGGGSRDELAAYVATEGGPPPSEEELRLFLRDSLPDHMIPARFVFLESLPLTGNGKLDRRALPEPTRPSADAHAAAPRTDVEETLLEIWRAVLRRPEIGIDDNFFRMGGDSILSIQIAARAHRKGWRFHAADIYRHPTVAALSKIVAPLRPVESAPQEASGEVPLTPIQRWFFEQRSGRPDHWNMSVLLEMRAGVDPALVGRAFDHLLRQHDALRLRFRQTRAGWRQHHDEPGAVAFTRVVLSEATPEGRGREALARAAELQASLDLENGPTARLVWFEPPRDEPARLLLIVHHLAVDGVSLRILLEDFVVALAQVTEGRPVELGDQTTSFRQWARRLAGHAASASIRAEYPYWLASVSLPAPPLPGRVTDEPNLVGSARTVAASLGEAETDALLRRVSAAYNTEINDLLLTALAQTFRDWIGDEALFVELEGHGREQLFEDLDLSRTVGWFTTRFPVWLSLEEAADDAEAIKAVKEQLRAVPGRGLGYGLLRYLGDEETAAALCAGSEPNVSFNYLGQFDQLVPASAPLRLCRDGRGPERDPRGLRRHLLTVDCMVVGGRLSVEWGYGVNHHDEATVIDLAENYLANLRRLIEHCLSVESGGYTPSDFPEAELDQEGLDDLMIHLGR